MSYHRRPRRTIVSFYAPLVMMICAALVLLRNPASVSGQPGQDISLTKLKDDLSLIHAQVMERLSDDSLWSDRSRSKELYESIALAGEARCPQAAELLVQHIEHHGAWFDVLGKTESNFPSVGALISIGMPAVEPLLDTIKSNPPRDKRAAGDDDWEIERDASEVVSLCAYALVQIYDHPEGMGKRICKQILQAELKNTEDEKERAGLAFAIRAVSE